MTDDSGTTPVEYVCSITGVIMKDPVQNAAGNTYERAAIEEWYRRCGRCGRSITDPNTAVPLTARTLTPNLSLRSLIQAWISARPRAKRPRQENLDYKQACDTFIRLKDKRRKLSALDDVSERESKGGAPHAAVSGAAGSGASPPPNYTLTPEQLNKKGRDLYYGQNGCKIDPKRAADMFRASASQGDAMGRFYFAKCLLFGFGVQKDVRRASDLFDRAIAEGRIQTLAEQRDSHAMLALGECYLYGWSLDQRKAKGFELIRRSAESGNLAAHFLVGYCYATGSGITKDEGHAVFYFQTAADQGHAEAQGALGECYQLGQGVEKNFKQAVFWYRKSADQGFAVAQGNLGVCYHIGKGVEKNFSQAVFWYQKAADQGNAQAQCNLGNCYKNGWGVEKDFKQAFKLYEQAAFQGNAQAQHALGVCYVSGQGVTKDEKKAVYWYRKATDQDCAKSQYNLGVCYHLGQGVAKDEKEAVDWYRKAADQGCAKSQYNLGVCYHFGQGVEKDLEQAAELFQKAADQGLAQARRAIERLQRESREVGSSGRVTDTPANKGE